MSAMSDTLLVILAHSGAQDCLYRHWPFWENAECDILGVGRQDTQLTWPHPNGTHNFVGKLDIGKESYAAGDNHLRRFLDVLKHGIYKTDYRWLCVVEYDCLLFRKPDFGYVSGLLTTVAGGQSEGFRGSRFFHTPWMLSSRLATKVLDYGERMLRADLTEQGFLDRWLGLMADLYLLPIADVSNRWYSRNSIDTPQYIAEARAAIAAGCIGLHGVKTEAVLRAITQ